MAIIAAPETGRTSSNDMIPNDISATRTRQITYPTFASLRSIIVSNQLNGARHGVRGKEFNGRVREQNGPHRAVGKEIMARCTAEGVYGLVCKTRVCGGATGGGETGLSEGAARLRRRREQRSWFRLDFWGLQSGHVVVVLLRLLDAVQTCGRGEPDAEHRRERLRQRHCGPVRAAKVHFAMRVSSFGWRGGVVRGVTRRRSCAPQASPQFPSRPLGGWLRHPSTSRIVCDALG